MQISKKLILGYQDCELRALIFLAVHNEKPKDLGVVIFRSVIAQHYNRTGTAARFGRLVYSGRIIHALRRE